MVWKPDAPQGAESQKIRHMIVPYTRGLVLDIGAGPWKAWPHFTSVDNFDEWSGLDWRPDIIADARSLHMLSSESWDAVFSSHLLEHIEDTEAALREWWRVIKPRGYLVLYLPHRELYPNIGQPGSNPDHKHDFLPSDITNIMKSVGSWDLVQNQKRGERDEYSFFQVYQKLPSSKKTKHLFSHRAISRGRPECLVIRYGGIGDMLMASSIFPHLKDQGYRVTVQTTPLGHEILRHDPHIDEFWVQDKDQVPQSEIQEYWKALGLEYDRVINLSESIEGLLLALENRRNYALPEAARHMLMNVNYNEFTHAIAKCPLPAVQKFYPTKDEDKAARKWRQSLGGVPVIMWCLAGSSVHKVYPWVDVVIREVFDNTSAKVVFVGDHQCQLLEAAICQGLCKHYLGMEYAESDALSLSKLLLALKEAMGGVSRMICTSGAWSVRECLSRAHCVDVLVGPETGIMHGSAMLDTPKVVMLSHSSAKNLTKHWKQTITLAPTDLACYPCHRMHYNWNHCYQDAETGASKCNALISPKNVMMALAASMVARNGNRLRNPDRRQESRLLAEKSV